MPHLTSAFLNLRWGPPPPRVYKSSRYGETPPKPWRRRAPPAPASARPRFAPADRNDFLLSQHGYGSFFNQIFRVNNLPVASTSRPITPDLRRYVGSSSMSTDRTWPLRMWVNVLPVAMMCSSFHSFGL